MNEALKAVLYQTLGYAFSMILGLGIVGFLQRGFFFKFLNVKASMGRKVLIRVREVSHWDYYIGKWSEQDLIFGGRKSRKRVNNVTTEHIYRSLGINWVDLDGKTWAILPPKDTKAVTGFDPEKQESLVTRALYKPPIEDVKDKILLLLVILALVAGAVSAYFGYNIMNKMDVIQASVETLKQGMVVATGGP